jgi:hypothetical protein
MCGNEPCRHERDYTIGQAMKSYVAASALAGDATVERNALRATLAKVAAIVADPDAALVVDRIREVLEPTPKGKP